MDFSRLDAFIDSLGDIRIPACDLIITKSGERVYRRFSGFRDYEGRVPVDGNEVYNLYSATKMFTCACAMRLVQDGLLRLDDPVSAYLCEFSRFPTLTVRHLMSMQGGFDYDLSIPGLSALGGHASTRDIVALLAKRELSFEPGTDFQYSLCHDVLAAVIEVVSGMKFSAYLYKTIFEPMGIKSATFKVDGNARENMCAQYQAVLPADYVPQVGNVADAIARCSLEPLDRFENIYRLSEEYESGGAGLILSAEDYARFVTDIACAKTILTPESIDIWRTPQLDANSCASFDKFQRFGYSYALGCRVLVDGKFSRSPVGEFGWDGAAGAYTLIDPENQIAIFFAMHVKNCFHAYYYVHPTIRDLVYEAFQ